MKRYTAPVVSAILAALLVTGFFFFFGTSSPVQTVQAQEVTPPPACNFDMLLAEISNLKALIGKCCMICQPTVPAIPEVITDTVDIEDGDPVCEGPECPPAPCQGSECPVEEVKCNNGFGNGGDLPCKTHGNGQNQDNNGQQANGHVPGGADKSNGTNNNGGGSNNNNGGGSNNNNGGGSNNNNGGGSNNNNGGGSNNNNGNGTNNGNGKGNNNNNNGGNGRGNNH